jgi:chaperonin cofactor prefoldin
MVNPILLISKLADCDSLLKELNVEKGRLTVRLAVMQQQRVEDELDETDPVKQRQRTLEEIAVFEKHLGDALTSSDRADLELKILRLQLRVKTLDRQIKTSGPVAKSLDAYEIKRRESEIQALDAFIAEAAAQREYLVQNATGADADVGKVA